MAQQHLWRLFGKQTTRTHHSNLISKCVFSFSINILIKFPAFQILYRVSLSRFFDVMSGYNDCLSVIDTLADEMIPNAVRLKMDIKMITDYLSRVKRRQPLPASE